MSDPVALMISYYFPPLIGIASERAASIRRHLPAHGWTPVVVTPRAGHYHRSDGEAADDAVVRTRNPEISRLLRRIHSRGDSEPAVHDVVEPAHTGRLGRTLRALVHDAVYVPDAQLAWVPFAVAAGVRELRARGKRAIVYSSSVPYSSHLAARRIARAAGIPWVAEFRDPWTTGERETRVSPLRRHIDVKLHGSLLRSATRIVYTSEATRHEVLREFGWLDEAKTSVVRNGFEFEPARTPPGPTQAFVLLYAGTISPGIDIRPLLIAVARMNEGGLHRVVLRVVGDPVPWIAAVNELGGCTPEWLELTGVTTAYNARTLMAGASANLVMMYGVAHAAKVPGKLYEYIGVRRPVLAVLDAGEAATLVTQYADARIVDRNETGAIAWALQQLVAEHRSGSLQTPRVDAAGIMVLSRERQTQLLARVFEQALH